MTLGDQLQEIIRPVCAAVALAEGENVRRAAELKAYGDKLTQLEIRLTERSTVLAGREAAVEQTRTIAAQRLARIKVLEEGQAQFKKKADVAAAEARAAQLAKERLEGVCALLLREKETLMAAIEGETAAQEALGVQPGDKLVTSSGEELAAERMRL